MYGYLDASADTQWVRVMPVRDSLYFSPRPIDATVTLENMDSGERITMNDSLISYAHGTYAWNFWTTEELQPAQTYRITAERSDGKASSAEVTLPEDYPTPLVRIADPKAPQDPHRVYIEGVEILAEVSTIYTLQSRDPADTLNLSISHLQDSHRQSSGKYLVLLDQDGDPEIIKERLGDRYQIMNDYSQIYIVSAGPGWPDFASLDEDLLTIPKGLSNMENGVGYVAGIVSKTIPYKSCFEDNGAILAPCPLE